MEYIQWDNITFYASFATIDIKKNGLNMFFMFILSRKISFRP